MQENVFSRTSGFDHKNNDIKNTQCKTKIKVIWSFCIGDHNTVSLVAIDEPVCGPLASSASTKLAEGKAVWLFYVHKVYFHD